jgi:hypothetical protein
MSTSTSSRPHHGLYAASATRFPTNSRHLFDTHEIFRHFASTARAVICLRPVPDICRPPATMVAIHASASRPSVTPCHAQQSDDVHPTMTGIIAGRSRGGDKREIKWTHHLISNSEPMRTHRVPSKMLVYTCKLSPLRFPLLYVWLSLAASMDTLPL